MVRIISLVCLLIFAALPLWAQEYEPITGAFGWELGQIMDPPPESEHRVEFGQTDPVVYYNVTAPNPIHYFDRYSLFLAPDTLELLTIEAEHSFNTLEATQAGFEELRAILSGKYGPSEDDDSYLLSQRDGNSGGHVTIWMRVEEDSNTLVIRYIDDKRTEDAHERLNKILKDSVESAL